MFRMVTAIMTLHLVVSVASAGEIRGTLTPAEKATSVKCIDRDEKKTHTAKYDAKSGEYHFRNLPEGTYDIILETAAGRIEGVNLNVKKSVPKTKPVTLKPAELDKGEIVAVAGFLKNMCKERSGKVVDYDRVIARIRQTKMTDVSLAKGKTGEKKSTVVKAPLKADELPQISDMLLGLITLARIRDDLPRDFDLVFDVKGEVVGKVRIEPVAPEMTGKDRKWLIDWVNNLKIFENKKRVLDLDGTGENARVLVEKIRDKPTSLSVPEPTAFWRIEVFDFHKYYGGWNKEKYTVIVRQKVAIRKFRTYRWMFEKRLGGIKVSADSVTTVPKYEIPDKLDPARGRVPFTGAP